MGSSSLTNWRRSLDRKRFAELPMPKEAFWGIIWVTQHRQKNRISRKKRFYLAVTGFISNTKKKEQGGEEKGLEKGLDIGGLVPGTVKTEVRMRSRGSEGIVPGLSNCGRTPSRSHDEVEVSSCPRKWWKSIQRVVHDNLGTMEHGDSMTELSDPKDWKWRSDKQRNNQVGSR